MSHRIFRFCSTLLIVGWMWSIAIPVARANDSTLLTGSYAVQNQAASGGQVRVALQIRLQNHRARDLRVQRLTFWDFAHPGKGATQACSILLPAGNSSNSTLDFTIPRAEFELWKRGARPRLVLQVASSNGQSSTAVVRLDPVSGGKAHRP